MRVLITGGCGFAGRHLAHHLVKCGDDVAVTYLPELKAEAMKQQPFMITLPQQSQTIALDITDRENVRKVIQLMRPDVVYHLAGITYVPDAEKDLRNAFEVNTFGTANVIEALVEFCPESRFLFVSSAEVYGDARPGTLPLVETASMRPLSTYGVSKCAADLLTFKIAQSTKIHAIRVRPFPHIGPGQSERFAMSNFAKQLAMIKLGRQEPLIKVGNLEARRDYSDVSDIVRGYREAILNGNNGEAYNLCSGKSQMIGDLLNMLIKISETDAKVEVDPARVREIEIVDLYGSQQKALKDFGWKPRVELEDALGSLFAFWVEALANQPKTPKAT